MTDITNSFDRLKPVTAKPFKADIKPMVRVRPSFRGRVPCLLLSFDLTFFDFAEKPSLDSLTFHIDHKDGYYALYPNASGFFQANYQGKSPTKVAIKLVPCPAALFLKEKTREWFTCKHQIVTGGKLTFELPAELRGKTLMQIASPPISQPPIAPVLKTPRNVTAQMMGDPHPARSALFGGALA
jgi:hypothetical protein